MAIDLSNKVILVTGAGSGIGKAVAIDCAKAGAQVILLGRTPKKLEDVYDLIVDAGAPEPAIYPMSLDGANDEDYATLASQIETEYGRLDGVIHNAAYLGVLSPIEHYDLKNWYKVMQINMNAPMMMTQALIPVLRKSEQASVLFTTSGVARQGQAYWGAYGVSKCAQDHLMEILAAEFEGTNVYFNSIDPGVVRTQMRAKAFPAEDPNQWPRPAEITERYLEMMLNTNLLNGQVVKIH